MPIEYRHVDPTKVADEVLFDQAMKAEHEAFVEEVEVARLEKVLEIDPNDGQAAEKLIGHRKQAKTLRDKARRIGKAAKLDPADVNELRALFLNKFLVAVEQDHVAQSTLLAEGERQAKLKGRDAVEGDERKELQADLENARMNLKKIEATHALICGMIDAIKPKTSENGNGSVPPEVLGV